MKIFTELKELAEVEQKYTRKILEKLMVVERDKLFCDLKYPSLHKYLIKELKYSEAEATLRVNVVRLMLKSKKAKVKVLEGTLSLVNACEVNRAIQVIKEPSKIDELVEKAQTHSKREFKKVICAELGKQREERIVLKEYMLNKFDRLRKKYGDLSTLELIEVMVEKELKDPGKVQRYRSPRVRNSRSIPKSVKVKVFTGVCGNCDGRRHLEYDHKVKYSHGGSNGSGNIQVLCRSCNLRKEIVAREMGVFV